jgi:tRNA nucleotidyltransferase (CCA-adding enzyme)
MLEDIVLKIRDAGGDAYIFGGYVRDTFFTKFPNKDIDVEVYGLDVNSLQDILLKFGHIDVVGKSFAVIKLRTSDGVDYDFSLPRRERKTGEGHKSFEIESDPFMTMEEASSRRDFTMNAIGFNPLTKEFVDPYGGISDIENKILRATSARFSEDPLRVLRGMQFAGRFGMTMDGYTKKNCQYLVYEYKTLSKERIATEFIKLAEKSTVPSLGFKVLEETFWIHCFEVLNLAKILKPDIYARNLQYLDAFVKFYDFSGDKRIIMFFAILLKDLTNDAKCLNQFGIEDKYIISSVGKLIANYDFHISYDESVYLLAEALSPFWRI